MDNLLQPLEQEHKQLLAEQSELDSLSQALESGEDRIDALTQAAEELMRDLRSAVNAIEHNDP